MRTSLLLLLAAFPLFAASDCDRAAYLLMRGQYAAALKQLEGARTAGTSPAETENLRGLALMLSGDLRKAVTQFDIALELQPTLLEAKFNRAIAWLQLGETAKASASFAEVYATETSPLRGRAAYHNGLALDRMGKPAEAETWLNRALAVDPKFDSALLVVGRLRERRGDLQGAGRAYLDYLKKHPDSAVAALRFGVAAHKAGETAVAQKHLRRAIELAPDSVEAAEARKYLVMWE